MFAGAEFWIAFHGGFLKLPTWLVNCSPLRFSKKGVSMRTFADTEVQARILREVRDLYEKRGKLEAGIRAVDRARALRIETDALLDINAYKAQLCIHNRDNGCPRVLFCTACPRFSCF